MIIRFNGKNGEFNEEIHTASPDAYSEYFYLRYRMMGERNFQESVIEGYDQVCQILYLQDIAEFEGRRFKKAEVDSSLGKVIRHLLS